MILAVTVGSYLRCFPNGFRMLAVLLNKRQYARGDNTMRSVEI